MQPTLYWIATPAVGRLATMARPRGGDWLAGELVALRELGVDALVSLLTVEELIELELGAEPDLARAAGLGFRSFRSEERRVGKECRSRWQEDHGTKIE